MQRVGVIKFVQIQRNHMKTGKEPERYYRPDVLLVVDQVQLTADGIMGITADGECITDVHHTQHPNTRYRGDNKISFGFLQHYTAIREYFGGTLPDGHAGENMIVDAEVDLSVLESAKKVFIQHDGEMIELVSVIPAPPCRPFSEFCAGRRLESEEVKSALQFLDNGRRGYYAELAPEQKTCVVAANDVLFIE